MNLFKPSKPTSLGSRVRQYNLWLTLALFFLFSLMTVFIVFSLEDVIFKEQLQQNYQTFKQGGTLPSAYSVVKDSKKFELTAREQFKYFEFQENFGEFQQGDKHFHFMKTDLGVLLLDSTNLGIFTRIIDDIVLLLVVLLLPSLALTYWVSSKLSDQALKPFTQLYLAITNEKYQTDKVKKTINDIHEQDIKLLATKLVSALDQKASLLEEQIVFNQGMAHEIRTPLQVMSHSMELMEATSKEVATKPAFKRLNKSILRVNRISTALLWLTSNASETHETEVTSVIKNVLEESQILLEAHHIEVQINEHSQLSLPLPEVVVELIIFNLLTNVVHHCQMATSQKYWQIDIRQNDITFTNPTEESTTQDRATQGFGLGLMLVQKLTEKFGVKFSVMQQEKTFKVSLKL